MLPSKFESALETLQKSDKESITEIRFRADNPVSLTVNCVVMYLEKRTICYSPTPLALSATKREVEEIFYCLCNHSVYSHENEIPEGFISLPNGCRAGISGNYVLKPNGKYWLRDITSINIRISREVEGFASEMISKIPYGNILICGAVHTGKTTLLRDYVRQKSNLGSIVSLVDVRHEISGSNTLNVGINTDVALGCTKQKLIENSLRAMSPHIIAFDEIGTLEELREIRECLSSGVWVVTTFHAKDREDLIRRNRFLPVLDLNIFDYLVFLKPDHTYFIERVRQK